MDPKTRRKLSVLVSGAPPAAETSGDVSDSQTDGKPEGQTAGQSVGQAEEQAPTDGPAAAADAHDTASFQLPTSDSASHPSGSADVASGRVTSYDTDLAGGNADVAANDSYVSTGLQLGLEDIWQFKRSQELYGV